MPKYSAERIQRIRGHLAELTRRKVSVKEFAREIGVAAWTVHTWRRRFTPLKGKPAAHAGVADLIEIEHPSASGMIEVAMGGFTVRVPPQFESGDLERVLRVVREC